MTSEEAIKYLKKMKDECNDTFHKVRYVTREEALDMAIKALEQDTVPFDFELYQAGLMDMPKEMIKILDKIRAEIEHIGGDDEKAFCKNLNESYKQGLKDALKVIDKYRKGR